MLTHGFWKYGLITLGLSFPSAGHAETWHVTSGPNGKQHSTWTISSATDGSMTGHADVTDGPTNLYLGGNSSAIRVVGMRPHSSFCEFDVHERSADKVSGTEFCMPYSGGDGVPWSATIENGD